MSYAKYTQVPAERSKAELEKVLIKAGAEKFASGWTSTKSMISFELHRRHIRIEIPMPKIEGGSKDKAEQEVRRRWRAMILYVKAKLESVESNIVSFEEAFMSHIILPNGKTVGQNMIPQIKNAYDTGKMPPLLGYDG